MSTVTALRPLDVSLDEDYVRVAHSNYSRTNPELCSELVETPFCVSFSLFVPALGESLTYRALLYGGAA